MKLCHSSIPQCSEYAQPVSTGADRVNSSSMAITLSLAVQWTKAHVTAETADGLTVRLHRLTVNADAGKSGAHSDKYITF